jgi:hypothetical protein
VTIYRYEPVTLTGQKTVKCDGCGKRLRRQRTFQQTLNPWNKNAAGKPKTRSEIDTQLRERITEWKTDVEFCSRCAP